MDEIGPDDAPPAPSSGAPLNAYERRQEEKRARLLAASERREAESDAAWKKMDNIAAHIPLGQPILVGHHSEKRHRRDIRKIDQAMRQSVELRKEAADLARRADAVGTGGISQDDPDAVSKLRGELARMEVNHDRMTRINKAWRKAGKPMPDYAPGWERMAKLMGCDVADLWAERQEFARFGYHGQPCPGFRLSNNSANMRRVKLRIAQLEKVEAAKVTTTGPATLAEGSGWKFVDDPTENRIMFQAAGKPPEEWRKALKSSGFRWSPNRGAWVAFRSAHWKVERLAQQFTSNPANWEQAHRGAPWISKHQADEAESGNELAELDALDAGARDWHQERSDRAIASAAALDARLDGVVP